VHEMKTLPVPGASENSSRHAALEASRARRARKRAAGSNATPQARAGAN
jgi:hypothetical protein